MSPEIPQNLGFRFKTTKLVGASNKAPNKILCNKLGPPKTKHLVAGNPKSSRSRELTIDLRTETRHELLCDPELLLLLLLRRTGPANPVMT